MKPQRNTFKWTGMTIILAMFVSFAFLLPSVFAQGENPSTPTPYGTPPFSEATLEPPLTPEIPQENRIQSQSQMQSGDPLGGDWAAQVNISDTTEESVSPKIAADNNGILHFVWRETVSGGKQEIFYTRIDGLTQSMPIDVSNSSSFNSDVPQLVTDSAGTTHIVWQEEDNNHADDYEVLYSRCDQTGCTSPVRLSDGQVCSSYTGDWKGIEPSIGIDANDNIMVVWMSYEPGRNYVMYSRWPALGQPPANRTGCHVSSGAYYHPTVAGDSSGNFHLVIQSYSNGIFYSKYSGTWSSNQSIGTGLNPVIHIDQNNKIHTAWWNTGTPPVYRSKESGGTTWSTPENIFGSTICSDLSLITDGNNLPRLACAANDSVYESSRQSGGWVESTIIQGMAGQPDLVKDMNGDLHLVWSDSRAGNWDTFYSPTYTCEGIEPATAAGQTVLTVLENAEVPFLNYCKNNVENVIRVPVDDAFQQWADLASSATHEVAFTVMFWDDRDDSKEGPYPGEVVLQGIRLLHENINKEELTANYPHGMTVRILLGVQQKYVSFDQRYFVLNELKKLDIPIYKVLSDGRIWKVEVGLYRDGQQSSIPGVLPGIYSHVKLMVVDNNKMIVSGYHPQYNFGTIGNQDHDLGIKVSGPIAGNGMAVFDSLWAGSEILCTEDDVISQIGDWDTCHRATGENPTHWFFLPMGDDIVLPLYRDYDQKTADQAVEAAIGSATSQAYVFQNRFLVSGPMPVWGYNEIGLLEYVRALLKVAPTAEIRILVSRDRANMLLNAPSMINFFLEYYMAGGRQAYGDVWRFYTPSGMTETFPGLHAKSFMVDGDFLFIGSQNFDYSAFGSQGADLDLAEYSLGLEDSDTITDLKGNYYSETLWDSSVGPTIISPDDSFQTSVEQAGPGAVIIVEPGTYEIASPVTILEGVTLISLGSTLKPSANFSNPIGMFKPAILDSNPDPSSLLRITGDNVTLMGFTIQDSPGYAIEIGDSSAAVENVYLSRTVFKNNHLGGVHVQSPANGGVANYTIENNTFVGGGSGVTLTANATAAGNIRNNIFAGQSIAPIQIASADDGSVEYSYNLFYACAGGNCAANWRIGNLGAGSSAHDNLFDLDPLFSNPGNGAYQLFSSSPAIDAGDPNLLYEFLGDGDNDGIIRIDIGAFEYMPGANVSPVVNAGDDQIVDLGNSITVNATYSDADDSENHSARIDWGDGVIEDVPTNMTGPGAGEVTGEHTYTNPGTYTVEICVTDINGGVGCDTLSVTAIFTPTLADLYLHGSGATANPSTLFLDSTAPAGTTAKYKDSASVNFNGGNPWKEIGIWTAAPAQTSGRLFGLHNLQVWLGLKNSDDQGTNFDLRVEIYKNNTLVGSAESLCITGITRNPNLAKQVILLFDTLLPVDFNGITDVLSLKIKTRIGTNGTGAMCGDHSNAIGLRLYFDASNRPSGVFVP